MAKKDAKKQTDDQIAKKEKAAKKRARQRQAKAKAGNVIDKMQDVLSGIGAEKKAAIEAKLREII